MIDSGFETTALELLAQIARKTANLQPALPYTSISGTFSQLSVDNSVDFDILYNNSPYTLLLVPDIGGVVVFTTEESTSDIRYTQLFLGPSSFPICNLSIEDQTNNPIGIKVMSYNIPNGEPDPRGFGLDGAKPVNFELRFYTAV